VWLLDVEWDLRVRGGAGKVWLLDVEGELHVREWGLEGNVEGIQLRRRS